VATPTKAVMDWRCACGGGYCKDWSVFFFVLDYKGLKTSECHVYLMYGFDVFFGSCWNMIWNQRVSMAYVLHQGPRQTNHKRRDSSVYEKAESHKTESKAAYGLLSIDLVSRDNVHVFFAGCSHPFQLQPSSQPGI
jgi:hypothetical protein